MKSEICAEMCYTHTQKGILFTLINSYIIPQTFPNVNTFFDFLKNCRVVLKTQIIIVYFGQSAEKIFLFRAPFPSAKTSAEL